MGVSAKHSAIYVIYVLLTYVYSYAVHELECWGCMHNILHGDDKWAVASSSRQHRWKILVNLLNYWLPLWKWSSFGTFTAKYTPRLLMWPCGTHLAANHLQKHLQDMSAIVMNSFAAAPIGGRGTLLWTCCTRWHFCIKIKSECGCLCQSSPLHLAYAMGILPYVRQNVWNQSGNVKLLCCACDKWMGSVRCYGRAVCVCVCGCVYAWLHGFWTFTGNVFEPIALTLMAQGIALPHWGLKAYLFCWDGQLWFHIHWCQKFSLLSPNVFFKQLGLIKSDFVTSTHLVRDRSLLI